ncbi:MAG: hypothetical protein Tsb0010_01390 [Parvularculaceae bacterium]
MAEEEVKEAEGGGEEGGEGGDEDGAQAKKKKLSGKVLVLFIGLPAVLLAVVAAVLFLFVFKGGDEEMAAEGEEPAEELAQSAEPIFYDLPEMVVNLDNGGGDAVYLKLKVALELSVEDPQEILDPIMPRIIDRFQVFLRQLRPEDLQGSASMLKLKQELLRRINLAAAPLEVDDVLFREMVVQ